MTRNKIILIQTGMGIISLGIGTIVMISGCAATCKNTTQVDFEESNSSIDMHTVEIARRQYCHDKDDAFDEENPFCAAGFFDGEIIQAEDIQNYLGCEEFCSAIFELNAEVGVGVPNTVSKISSCEMNIDWELIPSEYRRYSTSTGEGEDTAIEYEYYGLDWEQSLGTVSCSGKAYDYESCSFYNF